MSSSDQQTNDPTNRDDIAPPDPTAGQTGDGPTQGGGAANPGAAAGEEGEGADKSTDR